ncbi:phage tail length tape measure family protein [Mesorhizobium sp. M0320]|uniref:phage tail length tape measure family protein n=1 Tax=Mesorhizobium sp. M0320 TaxID=2956936 RepID=UPI00333D7DBB
MADEVLVTELTIDARQAEVGSATYVKAMKAAQSAVDRVIDQANAANVAMEKQSTVMTGTAGSISSTAKAWDRLKASADPAFRATRDMERALLTADAASRKLGIDEAERARVLDLVRQKTDAVSASTRAGTTHIASVGTAAKLTSNQMLNLSRQGNDVITMFALGAPPMQIFASQAGQVFDALESGPQGALGSLKAVGAGILNFVATPLGGIVTAAGLAGVAIGAYALAARQDIKSADEVLKGHKALIDEIAKAYPAAAAAAKKYEDQASQMPKSVIAADTADNVADARKTGGSCGRLQGYQRKRRHSRRHGRKTIWHDR